MVAKENAEIRHRVRRLSKIFKELSFELEELASALSQTDEDARHEIVRPVAVNESYFHVASEIYEKPRRRKRSSSLEEAHPEIAKLWNDEKNGGISPAHVARTSPKKYWWRCPDCQHEWEASVLTQVMRKYPCQSCATSQRAMLSGGTAKPAVRRTTETLAALFPNIATEWHPQLNGDLTPDRVSARSQERAWWLCSHCGKPFRARIGNRTIGTRCPECRHLTTG